MLEDFTLEVSVSELKNFEKFLIDSAFHHQKYCIMGVWVDQNIDILLVFTLMYRRLVLVYAEFQIKWVNLNFSLYPFNRSTYSHSSLGLFIVDVLNYNSCDFLDKGVTTSKVIELLKHSLTLGYVAAGCFYELLSFFINFSLDAYLCVG